jgi:hypothetical protein
MKKFLFSLPVVASLLVMTYIVGLPQSGLAQQPVVVELFTSEGCSSCPPADAMLTKLSHQRDTNLAKLILLEEHVEYWNNGGWTDPFSGPAYTQRQYDYTKALHLATAYTPQIVIDGHLQASGNNPGAVEQLLLEAAKTPMPAAVSLRLASPEKLQVTVNDSDGSKLDVLLAVTEDDLTNNVRAGENSGRTLKHSAVVRELHRLGSTSDGKFDKTVNLPDKSGWKKDNLRAIVLVQNPGSGVILGAAEVPYAQVSSGTAGK